MILDSLNTIIVIIIIGALVLLAFLKLSNPLKINIKANAWFGVFTLLLATFWIEELLIYAGLSELANSIMWGVSKLQIFTPITYYLSVCYFTNPNFKFNYRSSAHIVIPVLYIVISVFQTRVDEPSAFLLIVKVILMLALSLSYSAASYITIQRHRKNILQFTSDEEWVNLKWLEQIIVLILAVSIFMIFYNMIFHAERLNLLGNILLLFMVLFLAYHSFRQKEIFPIDTQKKNEIAFIHEDEKQVNQSVKRKVVPDEEFDLLKTQLQRIMDIEKPHLDSELNLVKLAEILKITPHQLSYVINEGFRENFFGFINRLRIEKAKELLTDESLKNETILAIGFDAGFNSKTSFNTTFKKLTGQTPTEYRKAGLA